MSLLRNFVPLVFIELFSFSHIRGFSSLIACLRSCQSIGLDWVTPTPPISLGGGGCYTWFCCINQVCLIFRAQTDGFRILWQRTELQNVVQVLKQQSNCYYDVLFMKCCKNNEATLFIYTFPEGLEIIIEGEPLSIFCSAVVFSLVLSHGWRLCPVSFLFLSHDH